MRPLFYALLALVSVGAESAFAQCNLALNPLTGIWDCAGGSGGGTVYTAGEGIDVTAGVISATEAQQCVPSIVGGNLQVSTPCQVLVNNVALTFGANMTCDASSGSGTILFGVQGTTAYCWHNVTLTATNATAVGATTAFPVDSCALASATVTSGTVSAPVNIRKGRACPVFTSSSTATASADPSTGALQVDLVLSGTAEQIDVTGGTVSIPSKLNLGGKILEIPNGTTLPATCVVGEQFMDTDATSGSRHYLCESTNTWALQGGGGTDTPAKFTSFDPAGTLTDCPVTETWYDTAQSVTITNIGSTGVIEWEIHMEKSGTAGNFEMRLLLDGNDVHNAAGAGAGLTISEGNATMRGRMVIASASVQHALIEQFRGGSASSMYRLNKLAFTLPSTAVLQPQFRCKTTSGDDFRANAIFVTRY